MDVRLAVEPIDPGGLLTAFSFGRAETGAVVSFTGIARAEAGQVTALELDAYPGFTEAAIASTLKDAKVRFGVQDAMIVHRMGVLRPGEPIVFVAVAASHRRAAFEAADFLMDYLKTRAPFWKKSHEHGETRWIEPTPRDYEDHARWDAPDEGAMTVQTTKVGGRLDEAATFTPIKIAVLTISDTRDEESDTSGDVLARLIGDAGHLIAARAIVPDDVEAIQRQIKAWTSGEEIDCVITTGGTGLTGRDVTPEAVEPLFGKRLDGFSVIFHQISYQSVGLSTLQSRATAGLIGDVFVFCLPGSNGAVRDGWSVIGPQLDSRHRPCNLVELMPRLLET